MSALASFRRIDPAELFKALEGPNPPLVLDVRRSTACETRPERVPGSIPLLLDREPLQLPDVSRSRPVVAYCLCSGETSSSRVARWLIQEGYEDVAVLTGGLQAWADAGYEQEPIDLEVAPTRVPWKELDIPPPPTGPITPDTAILAHAFLEGRELPMKREMVPVFVDMVDSTELIVHQPPERVLETLQAFMEVVIDVGWQHCGDVHDFEGDGALLYFQGVGEALPAAFTLRDELLRRREANPSLPLPRISLDVGPVVIGIVGTQFRQTVAVVGPAVHRAARILKLAAPGSIIATEAIRKAATETDPELTRRFHLAVADFVLDEKHPDPVSLWTA